MNKNKLNQNNLLLEEFLILKKFDHPNIIKVHEFYQDNKYYYLITEYIEGGDLVENLSKMKNLNEFHISKVMKQLFSAINYIHSKEIVHRDLKLENILLVKKDNFEIKIIDFGISKVFNDNNLTEKIGTYYYIAPEILLGNYDKRCDLWSLGIILYVLLFGKFPFFSNDRTILFKKILKNNFDIPKNKLSKEVIDLLNKLLRKKKTLRITIESCLSHKWFNKFKQNDILSNMMNCKIDLRNFSKLNKIKKSISSFISHNMLKSSMMNDYAEIFRNIDKNHDGNLNFHEFLKFYKMIEPYKDEEELKKLTEEIFISLDSNFNGTIGYSEFLNAMFYKDVEKNKELITKTFKHFDKNGDGFIDINEFKSIFSNWNIDLKQWKLLIKEIDINKDGKLDLLEFLNIFKNKKYYKKLISSN